MIVQKILPYRNNQAMIVMQLRLNYRVYELFFLVGVNVLDFHECYFQYQVFERKHL
jgi:hypothetical protein